MLHRYLPSLVIVTVSSADIMSQTILLNDGNKIPMISLGTIVKGDTGGKAIKQAVIEAIEAGYRHIDTAAAYQNEEQIGEAIADVIARGIVTREELWITNKMFPTVGTREDVLPALQKSLEKLKLDYVNLLMIHSPENMLNVPVYDVLEVWKGMEDAKMLNLTRSIGVSNFHFSDIRSILENSKTVPSVNQIEVNPTFPNVELVSYCHSQNIAVISYAPFGYMVPRPWLDNPPTSTFEEPIIKLLSQKYGKTASQIVLRYLIDRGTIPVVKSTNIKHIKMNIDIFDFQLAPDEINSISGLNQNVKVYNFDKESFNTLMKYYAKI